MTDNHEQITDEIGRLMNSGFNCAESIILVVGAEAIEDFDPSMCKLVTGFRGGFGCTKEELCGALSGGAVIVGALHGRTDPTVSMARSDTLLTDYRQQFIERFGTTCCRTICEGSIPCTQVVQEAAVMLLSLLNGHKK